MDRDNYHIDGFYVRRERGETPKAWKAKLDYLLLSPRSLNALHEIYLERSRNGAGTVPTRHKSTLADWSRRFHWVQQAEAFDEHQGDRLIEEQVQQRRAEYTEQIKEFHRHHLALGKASFQASAEALKDILDFLDTHPTINNWQEAHHTACLIRALMPIADLWAKSLAVDRLLSKLDKGGFG